MSDFAEICITTYRTEQETLLNERRRQVKEAFHATFLDTRFRVAEDARTVTIQDIVFTVDVNKDGVYFRLGWTCPKCGSWHTYHVASRADVGRVLAQTGCSDCGG